MLIEIFHFSRCLAFCVHAHRNTNYHVILDHYIQSNNYASHTIKDLSITHKLRISSSWDDAKLHLQHQQNQSKELCVKLADQKS